MICVFFFFKQKTAYEIKECDWSSDVCSSDLHTILGDIWSSEVTTRTVDTHIWNLREKLEEDPGNPRYIITVHRIGYKFVEWSPLTS